MGEPEGADDVDRLQQSVKDRVAEAGAQSLSELSASLDVDNGTLFGPVQSLVEAGELRRVNFFTYREAATDQDDAADGDGAADAGEPAEPEASADDATEAERFWPAADAVDGGEAAEPAVSGSRRAVGVATIIVGLALLALGAVGVTSLWVGDALGPLPAGFAAELMAAQVGLTDRTVVTGVWAGLAAVGVVVAVLGGVLTAGVGLPGTGERSAEAKH